MGLNDLCEGSYILVYFAGTMSRATLPMSKYLLYEIWEYRLLIFFKVLIVDFRKSRIQGGSPQMESEVMWFGK